MLIHSLLSFFIFSSHSFLVQARPFDATITPTAALSTNVLKIFPTPGVVLTDDGLHMSDTLALRKLSAAEFVSHMGRGWNLGNSFDGFNSDDLTKSDETAWGNPVVTKELLAKIKGYGFTSLRIPVTYHTRFEADGLTVKPAWFDRVEEVIDWCLDLGMYCITNSHHDSWSEFDLSKADGVDAKLTKFYGLWKQIAARFAHKSLRLIFEPLNEPVGETAEVAKIYNTAWAKFASIVRTSGGLNADRHLTIPSMKCALDKVQFLEFEDHNWSLHFHDYDPYPFTFSAWGNTTWGTDGDKQAISMSFDIAVAKNPAMILGEYAKLVSSDRIATRAGNRKWYAWYNHLMEKNNIHGFLWDDGSILDRHTLEWPNPHESLYPIFHSGSAMSTAGTIYIKKASKIMSDNVFTIQASNHMSNNSFKPKENTLLKVVGSEQQTLLWKDGYADYRIPKATLQAAADGTKTGIVKQMTFDFKVGGQMMIPLVVYATPTTPKPVIQIKASQIGALTTDYPIPVEFNGSELAGVRGVMLDKGATAASVTQANMKCAVGADSFTQYFGPRSHCYMTYHNQFQVTDTGISLNHEFVTSLGSGSVLLTLDFQPRDTNQLNIILEIV